MLLLLLLRGLDEHELARFAGETTDTAMVYEGILLGTANYSPVIHFSPDAESLSHIGTVCCNSLQCTNTKFNVNNSHTTNIVTRRNNNNDYHCLAMSCLGLHTQPTAGVSLFAAYLPPGGNLLMQRRYFTKDPCKQYAL